MQAGIEVDAVDKSGFSSLYFAAAKGSVDVCRELLERGANPNLMANLSGGMTPIHACIFPKATTDLLQVMFDAKADPNIQANSSDMAMFLKNLGCESPMLVSHAFYCRG